MSRKNNLFVYLYSAGEKCGRLRRMFEKTVIWTQECDDFGS